MPKAQSECQKRKGVEHKSEVSLLSLKEGGTGSPMKNCRRSETAF